MPKTIITNNPAGCSLSFIRHLTPNRMSPPLEHALAGHRAIVSSTAAILSIDAVSIRSVACDTYRAGLICSKRLADPTDTVTRPANVQAIGEPDARVPATSQIPQASIPTEMRYAAAVSISILQVSSGNVLYSASRGHQTLWESSSICCARRSSSSRRTPGGVP